MAARILRCRRQRFGTRVRLAQAMGKSEHDVYRWEKARTTPTPENLRLLADTLGVPFEWLASGSGVPPRLDEAG